MLSGSQKIKDTVVKKREGRKSRALYKRHIHSEPLFYARGRKLSRSDRRERERASTPGISRCSRPYSNTERRRRLKFTQSRRRGCARTFHRGLLLSSIPLRDKTLYLTFSLSGSRVFRRLPSAVAAAAGRARTPGKVHARKRDMAPDGKYLGGQL